MVSIGKWKAVALPLEAMNYTVLAHQIPRNHVFRVLTVPIKSSSLNFTVKMTQTGTEPC